MVSAIASGSGQSALQSRRESGSETSLKYHQLRCVFNYRRWNSVCQADPNKPEIPIKLVGF